MSSDSKTSSPRSSTGASRGLTKTAGTLEVGTSWISFFFFNQGKKKEEKVRFFDFFCEKFFFPLFLFLLLIPSSHLGIVRGLVPVFLMLQRERERKIGKKRE